MHRNASLSKGVVLAINLNISKVPLLTTGKVITYVSTSSFMYVFRSQSLISKLAETLLKGMEQWYLGEGVAIVRDSISQQAGSGQEE